MGFCIVPEGQQLRLTALRQRLVRGLFHRAEAAVKLVAGPVEGVLRVHARHLGDFGGHKQRVAQLLPDAVGRIGGLTGLQGGPELTDLLFQLVQSGCTRDDLDSISERDLTQFLNFSADYAALTVGKMGADMATMEEMKRAYGV